MTPSLSFYLDLLRFGAALTVFVSHYAAGRISGGLFWQAGNYSRTAVLAFFVLSGFVIAWVTEAREDRLGDYALSRAARLYSVVVPAFILTALLNCLGSAIDPRLYAPVLSDSTFHAVLGYALSALFLGESWTLAILPGRNVPFWSLNYEAWYYILFAAAIFLRGRRRNAALAGAALLAGPKILLLFPIWLMGVGAWRWRASLPSRLGEPLLIASLAGLFSARGNGRPGSVLASRGELAAAKLLRLRLCHRWADCPADPGARQRQAADAGKPLRGSRPLARWDKLRALSAALSTPEFPGGDDFRARRTTSSTGSWYLSSPSEWRSRWHGLSSRARRS